MITTTSLVVRVDKKLLEIYSVGITSVDIIQSKSVTLISL